MHEQMLVKISQIQHPTHNPWILLEETNWITERFGTGAYESEFRQRLDNTIYLPLIEQVFSERLNRISKE